MFNTSEVEQFNFQITCTHTHTHTEDLITQLFQLAKPQEDISPILMHQAFKYLYCISKVRGPKVVVRWFSHEVSDLVPVMQLLQQQDRRDNAVSKSILRYGIM